jgi:hypothetical protein
MNERESPGKRTVKQSDELLQKSRRLIDELEFILDRLDKGSRRKTKTGRTDSDRKEGGARSG